VTLNHPSLVAGGTYEARLYANDGYTLLAKSAPFVLNPTGPVVAVTTAPAVRGQSITTKWSGIATPTTWDWVGIYTPGSPETSYLDWAYTNGGSSGAAYVTLSHPSLVPGSTYEARLYANDGYTLLAKSPPFTLATTTQPTTPAKLYYYHNDHRGTPQVLTDSSGAVVWRATYDPFGQATVTVNTITNNLRDAGQYFDSETGLHYNWFRYYDPKVGRYISSDPIGLKGGLNTYLYARANPLRYTDPLGLASLQLPSNGNIWSGSDDQDWVCSTPMGIFNIWSCTEQCCIQHDLCYQQLGCNFSSWGRTLSSRPSACQICNLMAVSCIARNIGKNNCGLTCPAPKRPKNN
jgi:RHS repeat-associated protein